MSVFYSEDEDTISYRKHAPNRKHTQSGTHTTSPNVSTTNKTKNLTTLQSKPEDKINSSTVIIIIHNNSNYYC
jgi:hypothetical protein